MISTWNYLIFLLNSGIRDHQGHEKLEKHTQNGTQKMNVSEAPEGGNRPPVTKESASHHVKYYFFHESRDALVIFDSANDVFGVLASNFSIFEICENQNSACVKII